MFKFTTNKNTSTQTIEVVKDFSVPFCPSYLKQFDRLFFVQSRHNKDNISSLRFWVTVFSTHFLKLIHNS